MNQRQSLHVRPKLMDGRMRWMQSVLAAAVAVQVASCGGGGSSASSTEPLPPVSSASSPVQRAVALAAASAPSGVLTSSTDFAAKLVSAINGRWYGAIATSKKVLAAYPLLLGPEQFTGGLVLPVQPYIYVTGLTNGSGRSSRFSCGGVQNSPPQPIAALESLIAAGQLSSLTMASFIDKSLASTPANAVSTASAASSAASNSVGDYARQVLNQCQFAPGNVSDGQISAQIVDIPAANQMVVENDVTALTVTGSGSASTVNGTYFGVFANRALGSIVLDDIRVSVSAPVPVPSDPVVLNSTLLAPAPISTSATSDHLNVVYTAWVVDSTSGRGVSGMAVVTDRANNRATITPTTTGFRVVMVVSGITQSFDVTP